MLHQGAGLALVRDILARTRSNTTRRYAKRLSEVATQALIDRRKVITLDGRSVK
jgi:hypothetical protein